MITFKQATSIEELRAIVKIISDNELGAKREDAEDMSFYLAAFEEIKNSTNNYLMIMMNDDVIIGTFHLTMTPYLSLKGPKRATIESVHIASNIRGNGYGTIMMKSAISLAQEKDAKIVQLTTNKQRLEAKKFYEKLGFIASHEGMKLYV